MVPHISKPVLAASGWALAGSTSNSARLRWRGCRTGSVSAQLAQLNGMNEMNQFQVNTNTPDDPYSGMTPYLDFPENLRRIFQRLHARRRKWLHRYERQSRVTGPSCFRWWGCPSWPMEKSLRGDGTYPDAQKPASWTTPGRFSKNDDGSKVWLQLHVIVPSQSVRLQDWSRQFSNLRLASPQWWDVEWDHIGAARF
ncbi:hypothetical protein H4582DRAFT_1339312 [Lactarius indigo]|nr:hypothetical protein H4582DRAFT_1339312 [Lactarius indigo]